MLLAGGILAPSTGCGIEKFPSLRNSPYFGRERANRKGFAALVVVCGFVSEFRGKTSGVMYPALAPASAPDPYMYVAKQVSPLPIWVFHGDADKSVSVEESRNMVKALKAIGADVRYSEFPGVDHNAWDPAYDRADLIQWMLKQGRK